MTGPSRELYQRRDEDHGRFARARASWTRNWAIIAGLWLTALSAWLIWVSLQIWASERDSNDAARVSCERAHEFGPGVADDYERRGVFTAKQLRSYRDSIPVICPK